MTLQVTPLGTDGAQCLGVALLVGHLERLCQRRLVVYIERDEHKVLVQLLSHRGIGPYGSLHLTAVHTAEAGEVDEYGFTLGTGGSHTEVVVGKAGLNGLGVQIEVLRVHRRRKGTHGLAGGTPQTWHHIDGEGQRHQSTHDTDDGHRLVEFTAHLILLELQPATEISTQEAEDDDPQRQEHLAVEQMPAISQIGHREELQGESQFDES